MARRSRRGNEENAAPKPAKIPDKLARPFEAAMKAISAEKKAEAEAAAKAPPKPAPKVTTAPPRSAPSRPATTAAKRPVDTLGHYDYDDRAAFHQAFSDVRPLPKVRTPRRSGQTGPISDAEKLERARIGERLDQAEQDARARLEALVAGAAKFVVERDDDTVYGRRSDVPDRTIDGLLARKAAPAIKIDLHGLDAKAAATEVSRRIREESKRGGADLLIVTGKGLHSEGGTSVLRDVAIDALTKSAAAPSVVAFATAPLRFGGTGALLVRIDRR